MTITITGISLTADPSQDLTVPAGGAVYGGAAPTITGTLVNEVIVPAGGISYAMPEIEVAGQIRIIPVPVGGIEYGGGPVSVGPVLVVPAGGFEYGGTAPVVSFTVTPPAGGVSYGHAGDWRIRAGPDYHRANRRGGI